MKKISFLFTIFFLIQFNLSAQGWDPEVTLVSTGFDAIYPDITVFENNIHVVWEDYRDVPTRQVYYKRSTDGGLSWGPGERLSIHPDHSVTPTIVAMHSNVHVVWQDYRDHGGAGGDIYYRRSTNNGDWFEPTIRLTNFVSFKYHYDIIVLEDNIHIVWDDTRSGGEVYYIHSTDNGTNWSPENLITNPSDLDIEPKISVSGTNVFIVWASKRGGIYEVYFRRSTDNGNTWDPEQKLTSSNINAFNCDITSFDNNIHITWEDHRTGPSGEIFYIRSTNFGADWSAETRLTFNAAEINLNGPSITSFQEKVHLTWPDRRNPDPEIFYLRSIDNGDNWESEELLSSLPVTSWFSKVSAFEGNVFVVWSDDPFGAAEEIIFKRFMSPTSVDNEINLPQEFRLEQNYPNPLNPNTKIKYSIPELSFVTLKVYDVLGNDIETLVSEEKQTGTYEITWYAENLPSGIYFYRIQAGNFIETKKMILMK
jgi:hypothetical protein